MAAKYVPLSSSLSIKEKHNQKQQPISCPTCHAVPRKRPARCYHRDSFSRPSSCQASCLMPSHTSYLAPTTMQRAPKTRHPTFCPTKPTFKSASEAARRAAAAAAMLAGWLGHGGGGGKRVIHALSRTETLRGGCFRKASPLPSLSLLAPDDNVALTKTNQPNNLFHMSMRYY